MGRPQVINQTIDGVVHEPWERLVCDFDESYQGSVMESLGLRKGELQDMVPDGSGRLRVSYLIPTRAARVSDRVLDHDAHRLDASRLRGLPS